MALRWAQVRNYFAEVSEIAAIGRAFEEGRMTADEASLAVAEMSGLAMHSGRMTDQREHHLAGEKLGV